MERKLHQYLLGYKNTQFNWGRRNCCTFASEWIEILTGEDIMISLNKRYQDKLSAHFLIKKVGGILNEAEKLLKGKETKLGLAELGDVVCGNAGLGNTMGICCGIKSVFLTKSGLIYLRTSKMKKIWRVI